MTNKELAAQCLIEAANILGDIDNNTYKVRVLKGFNNINFGMSRENVRKILKNTYKEFNKTSESKQSTDDFGCFHIYYDSNNNFEAVEFFNDAIVKINNTQILPGTISDLTSVVNVKKDGENSYINKDKSVGITTYYNSTKIKSILFAVKSYYD